MRRLVAGVGIALCVLAASMSAFAQETGATNEHWVGTWATAAIARPGPASAQSAVGEASTEDFGDAQPHFDNRTLRQVVDTTIGGERIRVVFSNAFGTDPLEIGAAQIALHEMDSSIVAKSGRPLTFARRRSGTIPAGSELISDPVNLAVPDFARLAIDLYLPARAATSTSPVTMHPDALQRSYVSLPGDHTGASDLPGMTTTQAWFFLARVEVTAPRQAGAVVAFGDSITDGTRSRPIQRRWPDRPGEAPGASIRTCRAQPGHCRQPLLGDGAGVSALARFDRDVLVQSRRHARHRARKHQRHRHRTGRSMAGRRRSDRRVTGS